MPNRAKGGARFLFCLAAQSPEDAIPFAHAEAAQHALQKAGAKVHLQSYAGGHGWHANRFEDIKKGITWLEEQVAAVPAGRPASLSPR